MEHRQPSRSYSLQYILIEIFDIISFFVFIVGLMLCIRFFLFNPFTVVGKSMEPTFRENDFIIIDKITPQHDALATVAHTVLPDSWASHVEKSLPGLHRGDVVVFIPPGKDVPFIKRIIGLPGEVVKVDDNKVLICNSSGADCNQLNEPYIPSTFQTVASCGKDTFEVQGGYFVMGDHRGHTTDSLCCFGLICTAESNYVVPENYIIGRVLYRVFPESKRF